MSTSTNADTNAVTRTETAARVMISETKSGIVQYSFGAVPESRSRDPALAEDRAARSGLDKYDDEDASNNKELVFDVTLDAEGGANAAGLVFEKGPDGSSSSPRSDPAAPPRGWSSPGTSSSDARCSSTWRMMTASSPRSSGGTTPPRTDPSTPSRCSSRTARR